MAQSTILAAATAAGTSSEVVVGANPVVLLMFADDDKVDISLNVQCAVKRKIDTGVYQPSSDERGHVILSGLRLECVLYAPGTYVVTKPVTKESIGFKKDEV